MFAVIRNLNKRTVIIKVSTLAEVPDMKGMVDCNSQIAHLFAIMSEAISFIVAIPNITAILQRCARGAPTLRGGPLAHKSSLKSSNEAHISPPKAAEFLEKIGYF